MTDKPKKATFELIVELIKAIIWPLFLGIIVVMFWVPLRQTIDLLPSIISHSDTITIAGLSLKISQSLRNKATPDVEKILPKLSPSEIQCVLEMGEENWFVESGVEWAREHYKDVISLGLAVQLPSEAIRKKNATEKANFVYAVRPTKLGRETQAFLRSVIAGFIQELSSSQKGGRS